MSERLEDIDKVSDLLDRLRLDVAARARGAVVVEGPSDAAVIADILNTEGVSAFPVAGRNNVFRVADRLAAHYMGGVICLADTDFDDEALDRVEQWFLVFTDGADIEAMLIASPALDRVISAWGSQSKLTGLGGVARLRRTIDETLRPLAVLRRQSAVRRLGINFDALNLHDVVSLDDLALSLTKLANRLAGASELKPAEVRALIDEEPAICPYTGQVLIRGRDFLIVVDVALRKLAGNCSHQQVKSGLAHTSLLLTVRASDLVEAPFTQRLRAALTRALTEPEAA